MDQVKEIKNEILNVEQFSAYDTIGDDKFETLGDLCQSQMNFDQSVKYYSKALEFAPNNANLFQKRGYSFYRLVEFPLAIENYSKAINLDPTLSEAWFQRGEVLYRLGEIVQALRDFERCLLLNPDHGKAKAFTHLCRLDL